MKLGKRLIALDSSIALAVSSPPSQSIVCQFAGQGSGELQVGQCVARVRGVGEEVEWSAWTREAQAEVPKAGEGGLAIAIHGNDFVLVV